MKLLLPQIRKSPVIDEIIFWVNTEDAEDIAWMAEQTDCRMLFLENNLPVDMHRLGSFWVTCDQQDTIYVKIDDDIVWIEPGAIDRLVQYRYENPKPFLVFPMILNNYMTSWLLQSRTDCFKDCPNFTRNPFCPNGWRNGDAAVQLHNEVLEKIDRGMVSDFKIAQPYTVDDYLRNSVNVISWFGSDYPTIVKFQRGITNREEPFVTTFIPMFLNRPVVFMNEAVFVHFAYFPQRPIVDATDILQRYEKLSTSVHSELYHRGVT